MIKHMLLFGISILIISITLVNAGVHPDYVGLGVFILLSSLILLITIKPQLVEKYLNSIKNNRNNNTKLINN